jgi:DNA-binding Xre family transcriptional regulator
MDYERIYIHLKKDVIKDIEKIIEYKDKRDFVFNKEENYTSVEKFIVGCVYYYLRQIKNIEYFSGINDLGRPFRLENKIGELLELKRMSQKDLSEMTGIAAPNINNFVKNKHQPSLDYFLRIWIALECPPLDWMFFRITESEEN